MDVSGMDFVAVGT